MAASHEVIGALSAQAAGETGLREGTPVIGGAADLVASALAAGVERRGDIRVKFGGAIDILTASDRVVPDRRLFTDYHLVPGLYMPNGCMATGGSGLDWMAATFLGGEPHAALDNRAACVPAGSEGVSILPYFLGEKTPLHDPSARGLVAGLSLSHGRGHVWRALLEAYAYAVAHHMEVLADIGHSAERFRVSDGGSRSSTWMQIVADVLQQPLGRLEGHPGSCLGAAWTAAVGTGNAPSWEGIGRFVHPKDTIQPNPGNAKVYGEGYARFRDLYLRLRGA